MDPGGDPLRIFIQRIFYGFFGSVGLYISTFHNFDMLRDQFLPNPINHVDTFDFIVVGSGSSGAVVANRLSENFRVLLLEAGGEPYPLSYVPGFSIFLLNYPEIDWMHKTVPQKNACFALKGNSSGWSQGKSLGGTSNTNFLIHSRGSPRDFDEWAKIVQDDRWNYESVLKYFKKSEEFNGIYNTEEHGHRGPMRVALPPYQGSGDVFVQAAKDLGYQKTDLNGRFTEGFDNIYYPIKFGRRQGTYQSYIKPARLRRSLTVVKFAHVNKILLRGDNNEAYGVEFDRHGMRRQAFARKEIIVSAGAVQSPKLLMLSGIGPAPHLEAMKIPVKVDLPVGENLQDHLSVYLGPFFVDGMRTTILDRDLNGRMFTDFLNRGTGPLTSSGCQAMGFISSSLAKARGEASWPDIQLIYLGVGAHATYGKDFAHGFHGKTETFSKYYNHAVGKNSFTIVVSAARPRQRGHIKLKSNEPYADLEIDPKYLQNDEDLQVLMEGVKKAVELVETTETFKRVGGRFTNETFPGCEAHEMRSDGYWECYIRHMSITLHHIVGSNSMGLRGAGGVVDSELRVHGTEKLRVIDASVIPQVVVGNTNAPCVMLGEAGSDLIIQKWKVKPSENSTVAPESPAGISSSTVPPENVPGIVEVITGNPNSNGDSKPDSTNSQSQKLEASSAIKEKPEADNEIKVRPPLQCKYGFCNNE